MNECMEKNKKNIKGYNLVVPCTKIHLCVGLGNGHGVRGQTKDMVGKQKEGAEVTHQSRKKASSVGSHHILSLFPLSSYLRYGTSVAAETSGTE
jgi:hypothetical protein